MAQPITLDAAVGRVTETARVAFRLYNGHLFHIEAFQGNSMGTDGAQLTPEELTTAAGRYGVIVNQAVAAINQFLRRAQEVNANRDLSAHGKATALDKPRKDVLSTIATYFASVVGMRENLRKAEANLYSAQPASMTATSIAIDQEIRTWWRGLSEVQQAKELQRMASDPAGHDALAALMRSPIPLGSAAMLPIMETWRAGIRSIKPTQAMELDNDFEASEWAINALRMCAAVALNVTGIDGKWALLALLETEDKDNELGAAAFGTPSDIARARMLLAGGHRASSTAVA